MARYYRSNYTLRSTRKELSCAYGGLDDDLLKVFYSLPEYQLGRLMETYGSKYGKSAESYARKTYPSWKMGSTKPNVTTIERILITLPDFLDLEVKCHLLRKLREKYRDRENYELKVTTSNWMELITPFVTRIVTKAYTTELPTSVEARLKWLSNGDMRAARAILVESEVQEGKNAIELLREEFHNIENLLRSLPGKGTAAHTIRLP